MPDPPVKTAGPCPSCHQGPLVKNTLTKLVCPDCGWEASMDPNDSNVFGKPRATWGQKMLFFILLGLILLAVCSDKIPLIMNALTK